MSRQLSPDQWQQLESLIDALLDTPIERRSALFAQVTDGDPARRAELEKLVAECERAYPLLDRPAVERFETLTYLAPVQIGQTVADRYTITRELGRGGMATVYLARDVKHGRDVAIKIIRSEISSALGSGRFLREIEIAAKLRHPHIVPLYDSGDADGVLYYVMPFESGPSLRERLRRDGPFPIDEAVGLLRDVCDALSYAHKAGVVHRDIKPDNILLAGRHALVTDFGVAKALSAPNENASVDMTGAGIMIGTPAYMAPEQASADPRVDHRADIYAFGVLAFEMLSGRQPFSGDAAHEVLAAQLAHTPAPVTRHRADVPAALDELVTKCLKKRPSDRWQSADDVLAKLQDIVVPSGASRRTTTFGRVNRHHIRLAGSVGLVAAAVAAWTFWPRPRVLPATPAPTPPALAVLVFQHGAGAELETLATILTSQLINALGDVPRLTVRSFRAVSPYRDANIPMDSVARSLDVPWIVGGQVNRIGSQNVVSVELTDAATGRYLASRRSVGAVGDDIALIEDIVSKVGTMLRERLGDHVRLERWKAGTRSAVAFAEVNRAHRDSRDADRLIGSDVVGARRLLRRADSALALASRADPNWAEPHIQRAWIGRRLAFVLGPEGLVPDTFAASLGRALRHADGALRPRPGDPHALEIKGLLLRDLSVVASRDSAQTLRDTADSILTRATAADSTLARALNALSSIHYARGELEQARVMAARANSADAYSEDASQVLARLFQIDFDAANDREARRWCQAYRRQQPNDWFNGYCRLMLMGWDPAETPDPNEAWKIARESSAAAEATIRPIATAQLNVLVAGVLARLGRYREAERALEDVRASVGSAAPPARSDPELLQLEAGVRVRLGQRDRAVGLLTTYLQMIPSTGGLIARGRRFGGLPIDSLRDNATPAR